MARPPLRQSQAAASTVPELSPAPGQLLWHTRTFTTETPAPRSQLPPPVRAASPPRQGRLLPGPDRARSPRSAPSAPAPPHDPHTPQRTGSAAAPRPARPSSPQLRPGPDRCSRFPPRIAEERGATGGRSRPPPRVPAAPDGARASAGGSNRASRVVRCPLPAAARAGRARGADGGGTGRMLRARSSGPTHRERDGGKGRARAARADGRASGGRKYRETSPLRPGLPHWLRPRAALPERRRRPAAMGTGTLRSRTAGRKGQNAARPGPGQRSGDTATTGTRGCGEHGARRWMGCVRTELALQRGTLSADGQQPSRCQCILHSRTQLGTPRRVTAPRISPTHRLCPSALPQPFPDLLLHGKMH